MNKKYFVIFFAVSFISLSSSVYADVGWFSRANCIPLVEVNESITWDVNVFNDPTLMITSSQHTRIGELAPIHAIVTDAELITAGWRSRAGDQGDSGVSKVDGLHIWEDEDGGIITEFSYASNCNLDEWGVSLP